MAENFHATAKVLSLIGLLRKYCGIANVSSFIMCAIYYTLSVVAGSGLMADLWMCGDHEHLKRKKTDLCEIDIIMSSLRDTGHEIL